MPPPPDRQPAERPFLWLQLVSAICDFAPLGWSVLAEELADECLAAGTAEAMLWDFLYNPDQPRDERGRFASGGDFRVHPETKKVVHKDEVEKWKKEQEKKEKGKGKGKDAKPKPERKPREKKEKKDPPKPKNPPKPKDPPKPVGPPKTKDELVETIKKDPAIQKQLKALQAIGKADREKIDKAVATSAASQAALKDAIKRRDAISPTGPRAVEWKQRDVAVQIRANEAFQDERAVYRARREYNAQADKHRAEMVSALRPPVKERQGPTAIVSRDPTGETAAVKPEHKEAVKKMSVEAATFYENVLARKPGDPDLHIHTEALDENGYSKGRAFCRSHGQTGEKQSVHLHHAKDDASVAVHEWGHAVENRIPGVNKAAGAFLEHRCGNEPYVKMQDVVPDANYDSHELGRKDNFAKAFNGDMNRAYYAGKTYGGSDSTEIISMGIEELHRDPGGFASRDPEYAGFIIGILNGRARMT